MRGALSVPNITAVVKVLDFQAATIFLKLLSRQLEIRKRKCLLTTYALNKLHCALRGNIPRQHNTTVEIIYFHPSSCHHSSILLPANTMTLFLRQLGNVLVITPKTASLPKHSALRLCISHLSPDQSENKERKQNQEATLNTRFRQLCERCSLIAEFF